MKTGDILPSYTSYVYSDELRSLQNEKYTKLLSNDKFGDDGTSTGKNTYTTWYAFERFYSTIDKRFNSKDPVVGTIYEPERVNSYIYAGDNPLIYSDRDGRSFTCDIVNSRIFNKARDLCDTISKAINYFEKTIEPIVKTISKAYECYNRVFEKIPTPVKFGIGLAGAAIACLTGVGTAVVAGALVKSAISGAAFGAAMYGISAIATGEFSGKELVSSMINGAADMVMFTGATLGIKGAIECATRNVGKIQKAMLANESGESNALGKLDEFVERKAGKLEGGNEVVDVKLSRKKYPESAQHIEEAIKEGQPDTLTIDRRGASSRRKASLQGVNTVPGLDRDEYPPAMSKEGGTGASVKLINPSDNRGSGSSISGKLRKYPNGTKYRIIITDEE